MKRGGPRGSGEFEPISWDEALDICARELKKQRDADPDGVVWLTGYAKWYRPFLHRLAHSFGTENYLTESSTCHRAEAMSYKATFGKLLRAGPAGANTVIAWCVNAPVNSYPLGNALMDLHVSGGTIVVVDPRNTHSAQLLADLHLRPKAGTDAALAHAVARCILENGWQDQTFIDQYVHGFERYKTYVWDFTPERAEEITGVPAADIRCTAELLACDPTAVIIPSNALTHREDRALQRKNGKIRRPGVQRTAGIYPGGKSGGIPFHACLRCAPASYPPFQTPRCGLASCAAAGAHGGHKPCRCGGAGY